MMPPNMTHQFTHMSNVLCCSQNELWTHAVHPEHTPWEVAMVSADEVNHWFSRFKAMGAM